jgi:hypothetical protein
MALLRSLFIQPAGKLVPLVSGAGGMLNYAERA